MTVHQPIPVRMVVPALTRSMAMTAHAHRDSQDQTVTKVRVIYLIKHLLHTPNWPSCCEQEE